MGASAGPASVDVSHPKREIWGPLTKSRVLDPQEAKSTLIGCQFCLLLPTKLQVSKLINSGFERP